MSSINGYNNEYQFVTLFNNKKIRELDPISMDLIKTLYPQASENSEIRCWRNHYLQKSDILIKVENHIKGISIKKGIKNSVHSEGINYFVEFLKNNNIDDNIIIEYLKYHYADGTINGTGKKRISSEEYKLKNKQKINEINKAFNNPKIILAAVERFIIRGTNSKYPISALIYGEINDYFWITTTDIRNIFLSSCQINSSGIHFGQLQVQPKNRCLNYNPKYVKDRFCVQIKWYNLFDNIIEYYASKKNFSLLPEIIKNN